MRQKSKMAWRFAVLLTLTTAQCAATTPSFAAGPDRATADDAPYDPQKLSIGDRLKIRIFQEIGSPDQASTLANLLEHPELAGEYTVQLDGTIFLPLVGTVDVAEQTQAELQAKIEGRADKIFGAPTKAATQLMHRQPIYVTGTVPNPGTFNYTPGMLVLHAALLAGMPSAALGRPHGLEVLQQLEHLRRSDAALAGLLARRDVLVAKRTGKSPAPSKLLIDLIGTPSAAERISTASYLAQLEHENDSHVQRTFEEAIAALGQQRSILTESVKHADAALQHNAARHKAASDQRQRSVMTDQSYNHVVSDLDASRAHWNENRAALAKLELQLAEINSQKSKAIRDGALSREREIAALEATISEALATRTTLRPALTNVIVGLGAANSPAPEYTIQRHSASGLAQLKVDRFSPVRPGDILTITAPADSVLPLLDINQIN